ncbi:MAG: AIR synthase family protein [Ignavibacteriales bacterium]
MSDTRSPRLEIGKLPVDLLERLVSRYRGRIRNEVVLHAAVGEDSCAIDPSEMLVVMSTDPITGAGEEIGWVSVHISCNDVAANGAEPLGVLVTLLLPPGSPESELQRVMGGVGSAAREIGVEILGGHTEVTAAVRQALLSTTAIGVAPRGGLVTKAGASSGDALVMTKAAGLEATAILAADFGDVLARELGAGTVERARSFGGEISVVREGLVAAGNGATAMHDATEGGVLGAVYEMAEAAAKAAGHQIGFTVNLDCVPVRQETESICRIAGVDPLRVVSSGAMLIACRPGDAQGMIRALDDASIEARVIGEFTDERRMLIAGGRAAPAAPPGPDHIWVARENLQRLRKAHG